MSLFPHVTGTYLTYTKTKVPAIPHATAALMAKTRISDIAAVSRLGTRTSNIRPVP